MTIVESKDIDYLKRSAMSTNYKSISIITTMRDKYFSLGQLGKILIVMTTTKIITSILLSI